MVALDLPGPSAGLEALTCGQGEREGRGKKSERQRFISLSSGSCKKCWCSISQA